MCVPYPPTFPLSPSFSYYRFRPARHYRSNYGQFASLPPSAVVFCLTALLLLAAAACCCCLLVLLLPQQLIVHSSLYMTLLLLYTCCPLVSSSHTGRFSSWFELQTQLSISQYHQSVNTHARTHAHTRVRIDSLLLNVAFHPGCWRFLLISMTSPDSLVPLLTATSRSLPRISISRHAPSRFSFADGTILEQLQNRWLCRSEVITCLWKCLGCSGRDSWP